MKSIQEMAAQGQAKLSAKASLMASNYEAMKGNAVANYDQTPFGPNTKNAYRTGMAAGRYHAPDPAKWARNWVAKVSM